MAADLKNENNNRVSWPDGTEVEISSSCEVEKDLNTLTVMNEDIFESTTDPYDRKSYLKSSLDCSTNVSKENPGKTCKKASNISDMLFGTTYDRPLTVKDWIHERTLNAIQENFSDVPDTSPDTVQIIRIEQADDKKLSCFNISHRTLAAVVFLITVVLIITASGIGGYYLNIFGRVNTNEATLDETTRTTSEAISPNTPTTDDIFDETIRSTSEAISTNIPTTEDTLDETTINTSEAITTNTAATEDTSHPIAEPETYKFIKRSEYNALPPNATLVPLSTPAKLVIIAHTAGDNASCADIEDCSRKVRNIQIYHMVGKKYDDIGLNFLVGGDGNVYEGRGYYRGAHTCGYNEGSICISLIGNFEQYKATERQLEAVQSFIIYLKETNKIDPNYDLFGQIQLNGNSSPGEHVYSLIQKWPQFKDKKMERFNCNN